jgi:hypothetical protein
MTGFPGHLPSPLQIRVTVKDASLFEWGRLTAMLLVNLYHSFSSEILEAPNAGILQ